VPLLRAGVSKSGKLGAIQEVSIDISSIFYGVYLAGSVAPLRENAVNVLSDVCSSSSNGISALGYTLTDFLGFGSLIRTILLLYTSPFSAGNRRLPSWLAIVVYVLFAGTMQFVAIDPLAAAIARAMRQQELEVCPSSPPTRNARPLPSPLILSLHVAQGSWLDEQLDAILNSTATDAA